MASNFFCSSLFVFQNKRYHHQQGIEGTISCVFCPYLPKRINKDYLRECESIREHVRAAESEVFHIWDEDMTAAGDEIESSTSGASRRWLFNFT